MYICYTYTFVILLQVNLKPRLLHHLQLLQLHTPINAHPVGGDLNVLYVYNTLCYMAYVYIDDIYMYYDFATGAPQQVTPATPSSSATTLGNVCGGSLVPRLSPYT